RSRRRPSEPHSGPADTQRSPGWLLQHRRASYHAVLAKADELAPADRITVLRAGERETLTRRCNRDRRRRQQRDQRALRFGGPGTEQQDRPRRQPLQPEVARATAPSWQEYEIDTVWGIVRCGVPGEKDGLTGGAEHRGDRMHAVATEPQPIGAAQCDLQLAGPGRRAVYRR